MTVSSPVSPVCVSVGGLPGEGCWSREGLLEQGGIVLGGVALKAEFRLGKEQCRRKDGDGEEIGDNPGGDGWPGGC